MYLFLYGDVYIYIYALKMMLAICIVEIIKGNRVFYGEGHDWLSE